MALTQLIFMTSYFLPRCLSDSYSICRPTSFLRAPFTVSCSSHLFLPRLNSKQHSGLHHSYGLWLIFHDRTAVDDLSSDNKQPKVNSIAVYILGSPIAPAQYFTWRIIDSGKLFKLCEPLAKTLKTSNPVLEEDETYGFCKVYGID